MRGSLFLLFFKYYYPKVPLRTIHLYCLSIFLVLMTLCKTSVAQQHRETDLSAALAGFNALGLIQDQNGLVCMNGTNGIGTLDGTTFRTFKEEGNLTGQETYVTFCDSRNRVWLGPFKPSVIRFENGIFYSDSKALARASSRLRIPLNQICIKHAFPADMITAPQIDIIFESRFDELICIIRDNGIGRKAAAERKIAKGFYYPSKGLILIAERMQMIEKIIGKEINYDIIDPESNHQPGTIVEIRLPKITENIELTLN